MAFRALTSFPIRYYNVSRVYRRTITSSLNVRRSLFCPDEPQIIEHVRVISPCGSRGYASKKKGEFTRLDITNLHYFTAKIKGALKLSSLDENEAVNVEEVKQGMEDVLSGLRLSLSKLSVKVTPGE